MHNRKMLLRIKCLVCSYILFILLGLNALVYATRTMEYLDRGVVAVYKGGSQVYIGWRMFGTDPADTGFNIYRNGTKINGSTPITGSTNYLDTGGSSSSTYRVAAVIDGVEQELSSPASAWSYYKDGYGGETGYHDIPVQQIPGDTNWEYHPNDASVGDLDGDGEYEIVVKRIPPSAGAGLYPYVEAYEMDGTLLWRINLGPNITDWVELNPIVYDFDSDGFAEVALKTSELTTFGDDVQIGDTDGDGTTDYSSSAVWNGSLYMTEGPEFLSIIDGQTGAELARTDYIDRDPISQWGTPGMSLSQYAHRSYKFHMTPAYIDGQRPSLVICRGIYHRIKMEAWDWRDGQLTQRWAFDTINWPGYDGQGNHNFTVGDVDSDGRDEIVYGSMCVDDNGNGLYTTELGHGDAIHMSDMDPDRPGLEVVAVHESGDNGTTLRDAGTGEIIWQKTAAGDTGRGCAAHIDSRYPGYQMWSVASGGTYNATDQSLISSNIPNPGNFLIWWDGDLQREILDDVSTHNNPYINKWGRDGSYRLLSLYNAPTAYSTSSNNWTKGTPCLSGDILGDWREECIYRSSDNTKLRIFTTAHQTSYRFYTLMHDPQYRLAIAWQVCGYNQPPHPGFYIGAGMSDPPIPNIELISFDPDESIPPQPDPMKWTTKPYVNGNGSIVMQAVSAFDPSGVEYYFECTYGGGHDSGWQNSTLYEDTGLTAGQTYTYTVKARDKSNHQNTTLASVPASCIAENVTGLVYWDFEDGVAGEFFTPSGQTNGSGGSYDLIADTLMRGWDTTWGPSWSSFTSTGSGLSMRCELQDGYVTEGILHGWSPTAWTIEISVNLLDISGWRTLIGRDGSSQSEPESDFYLQNNGIDNKFRINIDTVGGQRWILDGDYVTQTNKWYRLAVTSDGVTLKMYIDDSSGYSEIGALDISAQSVADNALPGTALNWTFGRGWYNGNQVDRIDGYLDNIRFSNEALTPQEFLGVPSASVQWLYGDFSGNHIVNYEDLAAFSKLWLWYDCASLEDFDLNDNCMIDVFELSQMAGNWLASQ